MNTVLFFTAFLASGIEANIVPRAEPLQTITIAIPTQGVPFTSTVSGCGTVSPFAVVGVPTGTFQAGTLTIYVPPQASATTATYYDSTSNETEVIIVQPLKGECAEFPFLEPVPSTTSQLGSTPTPTAAACPEDICSGKVIKAADNIINVINKVTLLSQRLQEVAKRLEAPKKRDTAAAQVPFNDLVKGFGTIVSSLTATLPRITFSPVLPPGCDTDTVVIALIEFVRVHQALLEIVIGKAGILENSPIKKRVTIGDVNVYKREPKKTFKDNDSALIGAAVAQVLRQVEGVVDTLAFTLLKVIPTRSECAKQQKDAIDGSLAEAILAYE